MLPFVLKLDINPEVFVSAQETLSNVSPALKFFFSELGVVVHVFNPSSSEAETGRSL